MLINIVFYIEVSDGMHRKLRLADLGSNRLTDLSKNELPEIKSLQPVFSTAFEEDLSRIESEKLKNSNLIDRNSGKFVSGFQELADAIKASGAHIESFDTWAPKGSVASIKTTKDYTILLEAIKTIATNDRRLFDKSDFTELGIGDEPLGEFNYKLLYEILNNEFGSIKKLKITADDLNQQRVTELKEICAKKGIELELPRQFSGIKMEDVKEEAKADVAKSVDAAKNGRKQPLPSGAKENGSKRARFGKPKEEAESNNGDFVVISTEGVEAPKLPATSGRGLVPKETVGGQSSQQPSMDSSSSSSSSPNMTPPISSSSVSSSAATSIAAPSATVSASSTYSSSNLMASLSMPFRGAGSLPPMPTFFGSTSSSSLSSSLPQPQSSLGASSALLLASIGRFSKSLEQVTQKTNGKEGDEAKKMEEAEVQVPSTPDTEMVAAAVAAEIGKEEDEKAIRQEIQEYLDPTIYTDSEMPANAESINGSIDHPELIFKYGCNFYYRGNMQEAMKCFCLVENNITKSQIILDLMVRGGFINKGDLEMEKAAVASKLNAPQPH